MNRYHRQILLPQIGETGQQRLLEGRVLLIGCGALGCTIAQHLARSGVGQLRIVDRDLVDLTNLHRQILFTEKHAQEAIPKAVAAAEALAAVNSEIRIEPVVADVHSGNIAQLADFAPHVILDGTDNAQTRYLINDYCVREKIPWVYGACVGVEGRIMTIVPGRGACLRCIFPHPPAVGELATCDTAGVLGAAAGVVGSLQAAQTVRLLVDREHAMDELVALDVWSMQFRSVNVSHARHEDCPCCGRGRYEFLDRPATLDAAALCGRDAVQIRPTNAGHVDLKRIAGNLRSAGEVKEFPAFIRCQLTSGPMLSVFPDGRVIVSGTHDVSAARSLVARLIGV